MHFSSKGQRCLNFNHRRLPVRIFIISCGLYKKASQIAISLRLGFLLSVLNHNMYGLNTQNMICPADIRTGRNPYATISANEGGTIMHVLLVNGSPHKTGCTYTALSEVVKALNRRESRQKHIGNTPVQGCIACHACGKLGRCVFDDDCANTLAMMYLLLDYTSLPNHRRNLL